MRYINLHFTLLYFTCVTLVMPMISTDRLETVEDVFSLQNVRLRPAGTTASYGRQTHYEVLTSVLSVVRLSGCRLPTTS